MKTIQCHKYRPTIIMKSQTDDCYHPESKGITDTSSISIQQVVHKKIIACGTQRTSCLIKRNRKVFHTRELMADVQKARTKSTKSIQLLPSVQKNFIYLALIGYLSLACLTSCKPLTDLSNKTKHSLVYPARPENHKEACLAWNRETKCTLCHGYKMLEDSDFCSEEPISDPHCIISRWNKVDNISECYLCSEKYNTFAGDSKCFKKRHENLINCLEAHQKISEIQPKDKKRTTYDLTCSACQQGFMPIIDSTSLGLVDYCVPNSSTPIPKCVNYANLKHTSGARRFNRVVCENCEAGLMSYTETIDSLNYQSMYTIMVKESSCIEPQEFNDIGCHSLRKHFSEQGIDFESCSRCKFGYHTEQWRTSTKAPAAQRYFRCKKNGQE